MVSWTRNAIFYHICVAECVLSKDPTNLLGYRRLDVDKDIQYDELKCAEETGVDATKAATASGSSAKISKPQAKGPEGKLLRKWNPE